MATGDVVLAPDSERGPTRVTVLAYFRYAGRVAYSGYIPRRCGGGRSDRLDHGVVADDRAIGEG
jgi:hypothetical protein